MTADSNLFSAFSPVSKKTWLEKVEKDLKGKSLDTLNWQLEASIELSPFYHADDQIPNNQLRSTKADNDWHIGALFNVENLSSTNQVLLAALDQGVNAPLLLFESVPDVNELRKLLDQVVPAYIHLSFKIKAGSAEDYVRLLENYRTILAEKNGDTRELKGFLYLDKDHPTKLFEYLQTNFPLYRALPIYLKNVVTNLVSKDLSAFLKQADEQLQGIEAKQVDKIYLSVELGNNYFVEIARIRAARILWANLLDAYGLESQPLIIDAHVAPTAYGENANTNMIRSMTIALAATIGGVDRLTVRPAKTNDTHADRIARNVQHLLKMESYLNRVVDPAAGSFYIERLTNLLAREAWNRFGGIVG